MKRFLLILLVVLFAFTACDQHTLNPIRFALGGVTTATPLTIKFHEDGGTITIANVPSTGMWYSRYDGVNGYSVNKEPIPVDGKIKDIKSTEEIQLFANGTGNKDKVEGNFPNLKNPLHIAFNKDCDVYGNVMSLLSKDNFQSKTSVTKNEFRQLFAGNTNIKSAEDLLLPVKDLTGGENCYFAMFAGCTNLTVAPKLPATKLAEACYSWMFSQCAGLTEAPKLPATDLTGANRCYWYMFVNCKKLTKVHELPATKLSQQCYEAMFLNCTELSEVPDKLLKAQDLEKSCYNSMFSGCINLVKAPELPAGKDGNGTLAINCYHGMFDGCKNLKKAPDLPAKTLIAGCYNAMFRGCKNLQSLTCLATEYTDASKKTNVTITGSESLAAYTDNWLKDAAGTKADVVKPTFHPTEADVEKPTFYHATDVEWPKNETYGVHEGWKREVYTSK